MTKAQQASADRVAKAESALARNQATYDAQAASGQFDRVFLNMRSCSLAMDAKKVETAKRSFANAMNPKPARDTVGEFRSFMAARAGRVFDFGFVNHGKTGDCPTVNGTGSAAHCVAKAFQTARSGVKAFVQVHDTPGVRFYVDCRMKAVLALDPADFA